jgi:hypothetical protein
LLATTTHPYLKTSHMDHAHFLKHPQHFSVWWSHSYFLVKGRSHFANDHSWSLWQCVISNPCVPQSQLCSCDTRNLKFAFYYSLLCSYTFYKLICSIKHSLLNAWRQQIFVGFHLLMCMSMLKSLEQEKNQLFKVK